MMSFSPRITTWNFLGASKYHRNFPNNVNSSHIYFPCSTTQLRESSFSHPVSCSPSSSIMSMRSGQSASWIPSPVPFTPQKFRAADPLAVDFLNENGYVVYSQVASEQQTKEAVSLFWDYMESVGAGFQRTDENTWYTPEWPAFQNSGVIAGHGAGQSAFLWFCRGLPDIKKAFQMVWSQDNLLVSFDGCGVFRPKEEFGPGAGTWFHFDQNGHDKKNQMLRSRISQFIPKPRRRRRSGVVSKIPQLLQRAVRRVPKSLFSHRW